MYFVHLLQMLPTTICCYSHHIKCTAYPTIVQEKYGDQDESDSSSSEIEDDTAYVSVIITSRYMCVCVLLFCIRELPVQMIKIF